MQPVKGGSAGEPPNRIEIGFGGGCHWCTEAVFQTLRGVSEAAQGFMKSTPPDDSWSEAVLVEFDPAEISLTTLIDIHLRTHASTSAHKLRGKYRSAIYVFNDAQRTQADDILGLLQADFDSPLVTKVLSYEAFKPSDERFRNYYATNPDRPFCRTYIDPKLRRLREQFIKSTWGHSSP